MTPAISATGLTREYYNQVALDDVNLAIGARTITGLLGRNGAGKTTLLRILAGRSSVVGLGPGLRIGAGRERGRAAPSGARPRGPGVPGLPGIPEL